MPLPDNLLRGSAPVMPLLCKELRDLFAGRAVWVLLLLLSPLAGSSFIQAVSLYAEASRSAAQFPELARGLSPFDGIVVPTFGALYLAATLLFPFIAIRAIGAEKQDGGLKLLLQMPYSIPWLMGAKLMALVLAWALVLVPCLCALGIWHALGGHLGVGETLNLLLGHFLYVLVISGIALFAAAVTDGSATAAIVTLAFTIGFWVLDFTAAGRGGFVRDIAALSLTAVLRNFERGIFSLAVLAGAAAAAVGLLTLAGVWLSPEDRRNSFPLPDAATLARLGDRLTITVNLAPEDPRFVDLDRSLLSKLHRTMPDVSIVVASNRSSLLGSSDDTYGLITYKYGSREASSRSTGAEEVLPLIYALAAIDPPARGAEAMYAGYPLVADARKMGGWFYVALPLLTVIGWAVQSEWLSRVRRVWNRI